MVEMDGTYQWGDALYLSNERNILHHFIWGFSVICVISNANI